MDNFIEPLAKLVNELSKLPGIGKRSAQRLAYHLLDREETEVRELAEAIWYAKRDVGICPTCQGFTAEEKCAICASAKRDESIICVVTNPRDVESMERTGEFSGYYHVLHGVISPGDNRGPEDIRIKELLSRLGDDTVKEVILATNPDLEGEATAMFISRLLKPMGIMTTRIAHGVAVGSDLEYADEVTLGRAISGRREI